MLVIDRAMAKTSTTTSVKTVKNPPTKKSVEATKAATESKTVERSAKPLEETQLPKEEKKDVKTVKTTKPKKTESKPESKSESKPESKPEVKAEVKPEVKAETKVEKEASVKKPRQPRKKVTQESQQLRLAKLIEVIDKEIEHKQKDREPGTKLLRSVRKELSGILNDSKKIKRRKGGNTEGVSQGGNKISGFVLKCQISQELRDFMGLKGDESPTRTDITNAMCTYIKLKDDETRDQMLRWKHLNEGGKRDLQNPARKMAILPDDKLSKLLKYDEYVKNVKDGLVTKKVMVDGVKKVVTVTDPSLEYWVLQKCLQPHIIQTVKEKGA